ncbi:hypothetical protein CEXT_440981 [Caerostris extrusa]|uniref:Uncharacterized protein n=1 Tax=Caerostris extrusa TaxID=172846 RepID=A0AAV4Y094_CAEEX|nr:hypothetical protein CEXT_440981 [Caerostris extrusa]
MKVRKKKTILIPKRDIPAVWQPIFKSSMALFKKLLLLSVLNSGYYFQSKAAAIIQNLSLQRPLTVKIKTEYLVANGDGRIIGYMPSEAEDIRST